MRLDVLVVSPMRVVFQGQAESVILPGEQGTFELLPYHKPILSRILTGTIVIDTQAIPVLRGIMKCNQNKVVIIAEGAGTDT